MPTNRGGVVRLNGLSCVYEGGEAASYYYYYYYSSCVEAMIMGGIV